MSDFKFAIGQNVTFHQDKEIPNAPVVTNAMVISREKIGTGKYTNNVYVIRWGSRSMATAIEGYLSAEAKTNA